MKISILALFKLFRSRNEAKEKQGPGPWALSYLKLVNESNGTTVKDGFHDLLVYKIDKKFDMTSSSYLELPSIKTQQSHKVSLKFKTCFSNKMSE